METKRVKLWLDADVIEWFKAQQGGARGYQTKINAALRKVVEGAKQRSLSGGRASSEAEGGVSLGVNAPVTVIAVTVIAHRNRATSWGPLRP
jgi:BrnA antitoxin of type II toxin-antitoxin system